MWATATKRVLLLQSDHNATMLNWGIVLFLILQSSSQITHCTKYEVFHYGSLLYMWRNPQFPTDLVTFTEEILNEKLHFLSSVTTSQLWKNLPSLTINIIHNMLLLRQRKKTPKNNTFTAFVLNMLKNLKDMYPNRTFSQNTRERETDREWGERERESS